MLARVLLPVLLLQDALPGGRVKLGGEAGEGGLLQAQLAAPRHGRDALHLLGVLTADACLLLLGGPPEAY